MYYLMISQFIVYLMRTIPSNEFINNISRFNKNYFCTIEKILLWPNKIRIYFDERGDYSFGYLFLNNVYY